MKSHTKNNFSSWLLQVILLISVITFLSSGFSPQNSSTHIFNTEQRATDKSNVKRTISFNVTCRVNNVKHSHPLHHSVHQFYLNEQHSQAVRQRIDYADQKFITFNKPSFPHLCSPRSGDEEDATLS